jgi:hypothetical protein
MPAIGMGLAWAGYTGMLWAYCLIRGYDVTLGQLVNPVHQLNWKTARLCRAARTRQQRAVSRGVRRCRRARRASPVIPGSVR